MKIEFEKQFGKGVDPWHRKARRYVKKKFKNPYLQHLAFGFIEWLKTIWLNTKIKNEMKSVDAQIKEMKEAWDEEERKQFAPEFSQTPSEVKGLTNMELSIDQSIRAIDDAEDIDYDDMAGG